MSDRPSTQIIEPDHQLPERVAQQFFEPFEGNEWFSAAQAVGLDPYTAALAVSPRKLEKQSYSALMTILGNQLADAYTRGGSANPNREVADNELDRLRANANAALDQRSGLATLITVAGGAAVAAYGFNKVILDGTQDGYDSLRGGNELSADPSILPGDMGTVNIFGRTLGIPGFRDVPKVKREIVSREINTDQIKVDSVTASAGYERGKNDPALDLELLGNEYQQDYETIEQLIENIQSVGRDHHLKSVSITGIASDELFGVEGDDGLGLVNEDNVRLAEERAAVGAVAFEDAAKEAGLEVPEIEISSFEQLLTEADIASIDNIATSLGLNRVELIKSFNRGELEAPTQVIEDLEKLLPRGVSFSVEYERTTTETNTVQEVVEVRNDHITAGLPMEVFAFPVMATVAGVATMLFSNRVQQHLNKRAVRKQIRKLSK